MLRRSEAGDLQFHLLWVRARSKYKSSWHFPNILCQIYEEQFQNKFKWNWIVPIECVSNEEKVRIQKELTSDNFCQLLFINNIEQERKENTPGGQMSMKISQIDIFKTDICKTNLTSPPWASSEASWLRPSCLLHPGTQAPIHLTRKSNTLDECVSVRWGKNLWDTKKAILRVGENPWWHT